MLNIAYIGNGKSTNRFHLPFSTNLEDIVNVRTIYSRSGRMNWPTQKGVHYTTDLRTSTMTQISTW